VRIRRGRGRHRVTALGAALGLLALSGALLLLGGTPAEAHENALTHSEPASRAALATPPAKITLNFRWRVQPGSAAVTVTGPDSAQWQQSPIVQNSDRTVELPLRALGPAGNYRIDYQGVTGWGRPFSGTVEFSLIRPGPAMTPPVEGSTGLPAAWIAGVLVLTAAGTLLGIRLGRDLS
jgi:hypothetical protein